MDAFLFEEATGTLFAVGASNTPMARRQRAIGMDRLPIANRGRTVEVFETGNSFLIGRADHDPGELKGITEGLRVRSQIISPLDVVGQRRGALQVMSATPDRFSERHLRFLEAVARWVGMVAHRAELVEQISANAVLRGRREATEELISLLTPRQREIAALIAGGRTNHEIAERLVLSPGTVANHVEHILNRLGASRRTQIATWITEQGSNSPALLEDGQSSG